MILISILTLANKHIIIYIIIYIESTKQTKEKKIIRGVEKKQ